jgi:hypothetical protein
VQPISVMSVPCSRDERRMLPVIRVDMGDLTQDFVVGQGLEYGMRGMAKTIMRGTKSFVNGMSIQKNAALDRVINDILGLSGNNFNSIVTTWALRVRLNVLMAHVKAVLLLFSVNNVLPELEKFDDTLNVKMTYNDAQVQAIQGHMTEMYNAIKDFDSVKKTSSFVIMLETKYNDMARVANAGTLPGSAPMAYEFPPTHYYPVLLRLP